MSAGRPDLDAADPPAAVHLLGPGANGREITARVGLAHADSEEHFAGDDPGQ
jgi:hypothetical protein